MILRFPIFFAKNQQLVSFHPIGSVKIKQVMSLSQSPSNRRNRITLTLLALALPVTFGLGRWSAQKPEEAGSSALSDESQKGFSARQQSGSSSSAGAGRRDSRTGAQGSGGRNAEEGQATVLSGARLEELATEALTDTSQLKRSLAFSKLLGSLTSENALEVMEMMRTHGANGDQWELFRYAWGAADPAGAMSDAMAIEGRNRSGAMSDTLTGWASQDPASAMDWFATLENEDERNRFRGDLVSGLADHDIGIATNYVMELAAQGDKNAGRYLESIAGEQLRSGDMNAAIAWSEGLPSGELKFQAMDRVASRYVNDDPEAAAAWAASYATDDAAARIIEEVGDEWAERDPVAAVAWLDGLPEGQGREEGMRSAIGEWARRDSVASGEYLLAMPNSTFKDSAVSGYAQNVVREDPEAAIEWANSIGSQDLRLQTLARTGREWMRRDREAAMVWLSSSNLPEEVQVQVKSGGRRRR